MLRLRSPACLRRKMQQHAAHAQPLTPKLVKHVKGDFNLAPGKIAVCLRRHALQDALPVLVGRFRVPGKLLALCPVCRLFGRAVALYAAVAVRVKHNGQPVSVKVGYVRLGLQSWLAYHIIDAHAELSA